jgi:transposase
MVHFQYEYRMIQTIPWMSEVSAATIVAEIGIDMSQFPDEAHLFPWAAVSPGNNESAGVKKSDRTRKGNKFIKALLTQVAWAASKVKDSAYSAIYSDFAKSRG